jgi:signal transduction histidine kinase
MEDNGSGIEPGKEEKIFKPFYAGRVDGTRLGLAIVKQIVDGTRKVLKWDTQLMEEQNSRHPFLFLTTLKSYSFSFQTVAPSAVSFSTIFS